VTWLKTGWKPLLLAAALWLALHGVASPWRTLALPLVLPPITALSALLSPAAFAPLLALAFAAAYYSPGGNGPFAFAVGLLLLGPAILMGRLYRRGSDAVTVVRTGFLAVLAVLLLAVALLTGVFRVDLAAELRTVMEPPLSRTAAANAGLLPENWAEETALMLADSIVTLLPTLLLMTAFLLTVLNQYLSRRILNWAGIPVPGLPPLKTWRLPGYFVFLYLLALLASLLSTGDGFWGGAVANLVPMLRLAFTIQALGFLFFLADVKRWPRVVPVLVSAPFMLLPPFYLVGLMDVAFPLRKYFAK
jgi:uncharacterized protein YybS (DUF2232 family)